MPSVVTVSTFVSLCGKRSFFELPQFSTPKFDLLEYTCAEFPTPQKGAQ
jgi:hypothetical protein